MKSILVIDDNLTICLMLKSWLTKNNYNVEVASSVKEAIDKVKKNMFDLVLSDIRMPDADGFSFLNWVKRFDSSIQVIMMTSFADIDTAVESIKMGAADYIPKPIDAEVLFLKIEEALKKSEIDKHAANMQQVYIRPDGMGFEEYHAKMIDAIRDSSHLLVIGDTGTGKDTAVNFIYMKSALNRSAFSQFDMTLFSKESFMNGTLTTKLEEHFDKVKGGLLHIKGFRKIDIQTQTNLLKVLTKQNRDENFTQIIITTTESKEQLKEVLIPKLYEVLLESYIELKTINGNNMAIMTYSKGFLKIANRELNKDIKRIDEEVYQAMFKHNWEGNIQDLKNMIFKMALITNGSVITKDAIYCLSSNRVEAISSDTNDESIDRFRKENFEKKKISEALDIAKGNKTLAATMLNIDRKTLYNKIRLYGI